MCHQQFGIEFSLPEDGSMTLFTRSHQYNIFWAGWMPSTSCFSVAFWSVGKREEQTMKLSYVGSICSCTSSAVAPFCRHEEGMNHLVASARRVGKQSYIDDVVSPVATQNCYRPWFIQYQRKLLILKSVVYWICSIYKPEYQWILINMLFCVFRYEH